MSDSETPKTVAQQVSLSMELSRQEYWSGLPFSSPGDLSNPETEPALQADYYLSHQGSPSFSSDVKTDRTSPGKANRWGKPGTAPPSTHTWQLPLTCRRDLIGLDGSSWEHRVMQSNRAVEFPPQPDIKYHRRLAGRKTTVWYQSNRLRDLTFSVQIC